MERIDDKFEPIVIVDVHRQPQADTEQDWKGEIIHVKLRRKGGISAVLTGVQVVENAKIPAVVFRTCSPVGDARAQPKTSGGHLVDRADIQRDSAHRTVPDRFLEIIDLEAEREMVGDATPKPQTEGNVRNSVAFTGAQGLIDGPHIDLS